MPSIESITTRSPEILPLHLSSKSDSGKISDDPRWQLALRVAASPRLGRSPLISEFLLYVCDRYIRGKASDITEQQIGVHVFGRREGYNSNDDNIVRNYARILRKRMEEYFFTEGKHEELRVEIPRGAYVPVFSSNSGAAALPNQDMPRLLERGQPQIFVTPSAPAIQTMTGSVDAASSVLEEDILDKKSLMMHFVSRPSPILFVLVVVYAIGITAMIGYLFSHRLPRALFGSASSVPRKAETNHALWSQLFQGGRDTFVVPADTGLVIMESLTHRPVSLADYVSGNYHTESSDAKNFDTRTIEELGSRRYTSIVDLKFVHDLSRLQEVVPERMLIRYARDLRMDDLRSSNVILLGSAETNPWVTLFQQQLNFRFSFNLKSPVSPIIINQHPLAGERTTYYTNDLKEPMRSTYGLIAYMPDLDGSGHVLMIQGVNMAGTQAAGTFLLDPSLMLPVLERAREPDGNIRPFEALIESSNIAANASIPHLISERLDPN